jgi:GT2 family glycosyltransferase
MTFLVLIPHYGSDDLLRALLPTLHCEIPSDEELKKPLIVKPFKHGEVLIVNNNEVNLGYTKACNIGLRRTVDSGYDVCWLLNNDTKVVDLEGAISALENEFENNPSTGVVGFKILSMEDPDFIHHAGTGDCVPAGVHKVGSVSAGQYEQRTKERWVTGASMAILGNCIVETGIMDDHMVNYYSDSDYCYRARYARYEVVYLPISIKHKIGQSANPSPEQQRVLKSDMVVFYSKWITGRRFNDLNLEVLPEILTPQNKF